MSTISLPDAPPIDSPPMASRAATPAVALAAPRPSRRHLWALLAITALGSLLRFSYPDRPPLWGDDAYTIYRTHAEYQPMLDILQDDGFVPLHYQLYWLTARISPGMSVPVVRALPAFWGTLMAPAIFLLAIHLVSRRAALAAALFAACSAYVLGYSRDGKMYVMLWSCTALSTGCLLWWFKSNRRIAWLSWVAALCATTSAHMTGMAVLVFHAIFFLTQARVRWPRAVLFLIGVSIAASGPAAYMMQFSRFVKDEVEDFGFEVEGLSWVVEYNRGRSGSDLLTYAASAYLTSWEWPKDTSEGRIEPWILAALKTSTVTFILLAAVGALPWSRRLRGVGGQLSVASGPLPVADADHRATRHSQKQLTTDDGPLTKDQGQRTKDLEPSPEPWWRVLLWLGLWMVIPVYFVYCRSMADFVSPKAWWNSLSASLAGPGWMVKSVSATGESQTVVSGWFWFWISIAALINGLAVFFSARYRRAILWLIPAATLVLLLVGLLRVGLPTGLTKGGQLATYWLAVPMRWWDLVNDSTVVTGLAVLLPGLVLFYCGRTWDRRLVRSLQFLTVAGVIVVACWGAYVISAAKLEKEIEQYIAKNPRASIETAKAALIRPGGQWQSIFMPRYFGFVWPAFCVALASLYMRLPTRAFRWTAMTLLIGVNLAQFGGRLFAGTEPPLQHVARDVWRHDLTHNRGIAHFMLPAEMLTEARAAAGSDDVANLLHYAILGGDASARVYVNDSHPGGAGHPGNGTLQGQQGKYYLGFERGYYLHPTQWKRVSSGDYFDIHPPQRGRGGGGGGSLDYYAIASEVKRNADLKRVIVWEKFEDGVTQRTGPPASQFGEGWKLAHEREYPVRFHWEWAEKYVYKRFEYVRG